MSYKPDESTLMAYLYGELSAAEKATVEHYFLQNPAARVEMEKLQHVRKMMSALEDKEVIAPPIFLGEGKQHFLWKSPHVRTILSIAASLILLLVVGKITGTQIRYSDSELRVSFGTPKDEVKKDQPVLQPATASLSPEQVQGMINNSLIRNNSAMEASLRESQQKLNASIQKNINMNSGKINQLVQEASTASQEQIQQYVLNLQRENTKLVKDYFQLTSTDQKKYIEDLLVDFAKYMKQQQNSDLQIVQTRLNSLEKNTDMFKQETEHILSSIITNVNNGGTSKGINN